VKKHCLTGFAILALSACSQAAHADDGVMAGMRGAMGPYPMSREASGSSWQPDSSAMDGIMPMQDDWTGMLHGYVDQVHDHQGGPRGSDEDFADSMLMAMGQRQWGDDILGVRAMLSLDPLMGKAGYPLLLQSGETADGTHPLIDRQHPHDLFMELAATYSHTFGADRSVFVYAGLPGEPALGPPAFMHRDSGIDDPEAPISHHWLDSTHVSFGVITLGYVLGTFKLEASAFHGREPDQFRWNIESGPLDSAALRASWNPDEHWSLQLSRGYIHSPEQLDPEVSQGRVTASVMYEQPLEGAGRWATTVAWGQDRNRPGRVLDAWLVESELMPDLRDTFFARLERVQEDELFAAGSPFAGDVFGVGKLSLGYIRDWYLAEHLRFGLGGLVSVYDLPGQAQTAYDSPHSYMLFARLKLD
jgi:hypothetical protein